MFSPEQAIELQVAAKKIRFTSGLASTMSNCLLGLGTFSFSSATKSLVETMAESRLAQICKIEKGTHEEETNGRSDSPAHAVRNLVFQCK